MRHMTQNQDEVFGPGTDLILSLFAAVACLLAYMAFNLFQTYADKTKAEERYQTAEAQLGEAENTIKGLREKVADEPPKPTPIPEPPKPETPKPEPPKIEERTSRMVEIPNSEINFKPGGFVIDENDLATRQRLDLAMLEISSRLERLGDQVNTVAVIGHTDEQRISVGTDQTLPPASELEARTNLDSKLLERILSKEDISELRSASNFDLGLLRAVSIASYFQDKAPPNSHISKVKLIVFSAGPFILPDGAMIYAPNSGERRRTQVILLDTGDDISIFQNQFQLKRLGPESPPLPEKPEAIAPDKSLESPMPPRALPFRGRV